MDTKAFTAALVALALLTGCAPQTGNNTAGPQTQGQQGQPQGQGQAGAGQGQGGQRAGGAGGAGGGQWQGGAGGPGGRSGSGRPVVVQMEAVKAGTLWVDNATAGAVVAETQSTVAAGASGTVKTILRQVGDWVEPGTPVIQLDDTQLKLSLRLAQASLETAKINAGTSEGSGASKLGLQVQSAQSSLAAAQKNYASAQALAQVGGISGSDLDNAQTQLQNAQANLESAKMSQQQSGLQVETAAIQLQQAQLNLANATIKAPYAGQISAISLHPGEFVGTSTAAFSLVSRNKVISFGVSPLDAPGLQLGGAVKFTFGGKSADARITQAPSAPVNGLVPLTASLPSSISAPLGSVGTLTYRLAAADGVLVPLPALQSAENKTFVYTAEEGKAKRYEVVVLADSGTYAAVSGIASGATVIVNPPPGLLIGSTVQGLDGAGATGPAQASTGKAGQGQTGAGQGGWNGQKRQGGAQAGAPNGATAGAAAGSAEGQPAGQGQRRRAQGADGAQGAPPAGAPAPTGAP